MRCMVVNGVQMRASPIPGDGQSFDWTTAGNRTSRGAPAAVRISEDQLAVYYVDAATKKLNWYQIVLDQVEHDFKPQHVKNVRMNTSPVFLTPSTSWQGLVHEDTVRAVIHDGYVNLAFQSRTWVGDFSCVARTQAEKYGISDLDIKCTS